MTTPTSSPSELRYSAEWAIRSEELEAFLQAHAVGRQAVHSLPTSEYVVQDGVALLEIVGVMTKYGSYYSGMPGTNAVRETLQAAMRDPAVRGILLQVDSPGGLVAGSGDLASDIAAAAESKPIVAYIEDLGASAAYRVAARASRVVANSDALVGSIGTYTVVRDYSRLFEDAGIKTHVVRAGAMKGAGAVGAPVTDEQLADVQRTIDDINARFLADVAEGRGVALELVQQMADGKVHIASRAKELGLIDRVGGFSDAVEELQGLIQQQGRRQPAARKETRMSGTTAAEKTAATITELKAACPGAGADFLMKQLEEGATVEAAIRAWTLELCRHLDMEKLARAEAERKAAETARGEAEGADGVGEKLSSKAEEGTGTAIEKFDGKVRELMARGVSRLDACVRVGKQHPELHKAYLIATNPSKRAHRLIGEKLD